MNKKILLSALALSVAAVLGCAFLISSLDSRLHFLTSSDVNMNVGAVDPWHIDCHSLIEYPDGTKFETDYHDANKTTQGLDWLVNRTLGFGGNASATAIYVGWSNDTASYSNAVTPTSVVHIHDIFNATAGQGNNLSICTLTTANWTRWATYGKFNITAKAYASGETVSGICKVFLSFKKDSASKWCYLAIDVITPTINLPSGSSITSTFVVTFS